MSRQPPSFDLVVATVGRTAELARFLESLERQEYPHVRVILVDQNEDGRLDSVVGVRPFPIERISTPRGLSHARNAGLDHVAADVVAFPDDDCVYPDGLLARVASLLGADLGLSGVVGRPEDELGRSPASWKPDRTMLTDDNLWNRAISFTIFLRRHVVETVGRFDEELGLGSGKPWSSAEEIDYLIRALRAGARVAYEPSLVVLHDVRDDDTRIRARDGASVGYLLRKHGYPPSVLARSFIRPLGGTLVSLVGLDVDLARSRLATFRGRVRGYRGAMRAKSSA